MSPAPKAGVPKTAHEARLEQLTRDNLIQYYVDAAPFKTELFPALHVDPPKPVRKGVGYDPNFFVKHDRITGTIPPSGLFTFEDCYISKAGTVMDRERRVYYNEDLISAYWMWFVGKLITKVVIDNVRVGQSTIGRFIAGNDEAIMPLETSGATLVSLTKPGLKVYGHWILDFLPMVYNFAEAVRMGAIKPPFKFLLAEIAPRRMLTDLFDIKPEDIITFDDDKQVLKVDRVVVPSLMRVSPLISPRMNEFVSYVQDRMGIANITLDADLPRRLFISRGDFQAADNRLLMNFPEVLEAVTAAGVVPIQPERLPWPQQLKLFAEAEIIMGEYGSGLHNSMFSPASTISIVMFNLKSNWNQSSIAALRGQEVIYIKPSFQERIGKANGIQVAYDAADLREAILCATDPGSNLPT